MKSRDITAICLCTVIGAGFATGRELIAYFVSCGIYGFAGIAAASLLFALAIYTALINSGESMEELIKKRLPRPAAFVAEKTLLLFLIVLYSAMLAAGGEVLSAILGLSPGICGILTAVLCLAVISVGAAALTNLSGILVLPMAVIIFAVSAGTAGKNIAFPPENVLTLKTVASPVIYLSYNMITTAVLILSLPRAISPKTAALQTGLFIFILSTVSALPLYTHYSDICGEALPIMALMDKGVLKYFYILFLLFAIFTTAVSNGYSAVSIIKKKAGAAASPFIITVLAYVFSLIGFSAIVDKVYFIFGIAGLLLLYALAANKKDCQ